MLVRHGEMKTERKSNLRGGPGACDVTPMAAPSGGAPAQKHLRLLSEFSIAPGSGIGEHDHRDETEYYLILEGEALVNDDGKEVMVGPGDVVVTSGGARHSIVATGDKPMRMIAVIVTDA